MPRVSGLARVDETGARLLWFQLPIKFIVECGMH